MHRFSKNSVGLDTASRGPTASQGIASRSTVHQIMACLSFLMRIFGNRAKNSGTARPIASSSETKCEISESRLWDQLACTPHSVAYSKFECLGPPSEVLRHHEAKTKTASEDIQHQPLAKIESDDDFLGAGVFGTDSDKSPAWSLHDIIVKEQQRLPSREILSEQQEMMREMQTMLEEHSSWATASSSSEIVVDSNDSPSIPGLQVKSTGCCTWMKCIPKVCTES